MNEVSGIEDLRVLAVEQYGAGPFASLQLADLGAEVIKIEAPDERGDVARYVPPFQSGDDSLFFQTFNRGKRSLALDLRAKAGQEVFQRLVARSDAVLCNLRGDVPEDLGLRYADLCQANPAIVCCSLSGFGVDGPRRAEPAFDYVLQGLAGWMSLTGEPAGPPTKSGLSLVDYCGGLVAAISLLAGVHVARRDGRGGDCDVSLFDTAISMLSYPATWWLNEGLPATRTRQSSHPSITPFGAFPSADGWIVLACVKERQWRSMASVVGPELLGDARFTDAGRRHQNRESLIDELNQRLADRPTEVWVRELSAVGVPCGPVHSLEEALDDPQTAARGLILEAEHEERGAVRQVASAPRGWWPKRKARPAPGYGADRDQVLQELLGIDRAAINALEAEGAFSSKRGPA